MLRRLAAKITNDDRKVAEDRIHQATLEFQNNQNLLETLRNRQVTINQILDGEFARLNEALINLKSVAGKLEVESLPGMPPGLSRQLFASLTILANQNVAVKNNFESWVDKSTDEGSLQLALLSVQEKVAAVNQTLEIINQAKADLEIQAQKISQANLESEKARIENDIQEGQAKFSEFVLAKGDEVKRLRDEIAQNTLQHFEQDKADIKAKIDNARNELNNAAAFLNKAQKGTKEIQEAMSVARVAIAAAGSIPSGIITGTAAGTFTDYPKSLMDIAKMGVQLVELANRAEITYENIRTQISKVQGQVTEFESKLRSVNTESIRQQLERQLNKERDFISGEGEKLNVFLSAKKSEAQAKVQEISKSALAVTQLSQGQIAAKVRQYEAMRDEAKLALQRAQGVQEATAHRGADRVFVLQAIVDRIMKLRQESKDIDDSVSPVKPQNVPIPEHPSEELQIVIQQTDAAIAAIKLNQTNPETVDAVGVFESSTSHFSPSVLDLSNEFERKLEETNKALFRLANWLFFMTNDATIFDWASFRCLCSSEMARR
jgi:hypothetical protein